MKKMAEAKPLDAVAIKPKVKPVTASGIKPKAKPPIKRPSKKVSKRVSKRRSKRARNKAPIKASKPIDTSLTIEIGIERGNRMLLRWPADLKSLTEQLTYSDTSIIGNLLGRVEELKDGVCKKLTPLNYINAHQVLSFVKIYEKIPGYNLVLSKDFIKWFKEEHKAKDDAKEAYKVLEYDHDTIQTEFPFLKIPLYPWQTAAMRFLNVATRHGKGAFVCDETGLGKTYSSLAHIVSQGLQAVVVAPSGVKTGWERKIKHLTNLTVCVADGGYPHNAHKFDVIILSYAMLKKHGPWPLSDIIENQQRVLILDEGHLAKNYDAKRTHMAMLLANKAKHTIVVTATPLKNRILELHPLLRATRRLWTECSQRDFVKMYDSSEGRADVAEHLEGIMCRRMIKDVWKNPPNYEMGEAWMELSNRADYDEAESDFINYLINKGFSNERIEAAERGRVLVQLNKLRELSALGKVEEAAKIIGKTMDAGEQIVVFCSYNEPLKKLARLFRNKRGKNFKGKKFAGSALIIGQTPQKKRTRIIDDFMAGKIGLLCLGTGAGGLGIDLPIACYGYFLDLPWTPADIEQCTGRIMRLGQERDCLFLKCLADKTIDQRMEAIIQRKALIFQEAIGDKDAVSRVTASNSLKQSVVSALIQSYVRDATRRLVE